MAEYFTGQLFIPVQVFLLKFDIHYIAEILQKKTPITQH